MTSYSEQIISDLAKHELRDLDCRKKMRVTSEIEDAKVYIALAESKIERLRKKIEKLESENNYLLKQPDFKETKERIRQKLQTFDGFVEYLPHLRPGRPKKYHQQTFASGINKKQMRDRMIVDELKRRQAKNPKRPVTSGASEASQKNTHANDLAVDLRKAGIPRVGYSTIKNAWRMRDNN